jgi:pimeloyl-ACP methyl ester carboxylesterase
VRQRGDNIVVFFDGGAGSCPAPLREAHRLVTWNGHADRFNGCFDDPSVNQAHVIGHSAGGNAALRFALAHPVRIRSLILSESAAGMRLSHSRLRGVTVPVLVVAGGDESACPVPTARKLAQRFSSGRVAEIVEAARSPYSETPEEWCEVVLQFLRFVTRQEDSRA